MHVRIDAGDDDISLSSIVYQRSMCVSVKWNKANDRMHAWNEGKNSNDGFTFTAAQQRRVQQSEKKDYYIP